MNEIKLRFDLNHYFQVALRWLLQKENVPSLVIGVKSLEQLDDNFGSLGWTLDKEDMDELNWVKFPTDRLPKI